jgi:hypothetical protein
MLLIFLLLFFLFLLSFLQNLQDLDVTSSLSLGFKLYGNVCLKIAFTSIKELEMFFDFRDNRGFSISFDNAIFREFLKPVVGHIKEQCFKFLSTLSRPIFASLGKKICWSPVSREMM